MSNPFAVQPAFTAQPEPARPGSRGNGDGGDFAAVMESENRRDDTGHRTERAARDRDEAQATRDRDQAQATRDRDEAQAPRDRDEARNARTDARDDADRAQERRRDTDRTSTEGRANETRHREKADADSDAGDAKKETEADAGVASAANAAQRRHGDGANPFGTQRRGETSVRARQVAGAAAQAAKAQSNKAQPDTAQQTHGTDANTQRLRAGDLQRLAEGEARDRQLAGQPVKVTVASRTGAVRPGGPISGATAFAATSVAQRTAQAREAFAGDLAGKGDRARPDKAGDTRLAGSLRAEAASQAAQPAARPQMAAAVEGVARAGLEGQAGQQLPQQGATGDAARLAQDLAAGTARSGGEASASQSATTTTPTSAAASGTPTQSFDPVMQSITTPGQGGGQAMDGTGAARGADGQAQAQAQTRAMPAQPVQEQVAVQLNRAVANGQSRLSMRLHPAELGRIEVKLDMNDDGSVRATLSVEKPETLEMMQRDVRSLEKAELQSQRSGRRPGRRR